jgi:hypothetical protein
MSKHRKIYSELPKNQLNTLNLAGNTNKSNDNFIIGKSTGKYDDDMNYHKNYESSFDFNNDTKFSKIYVQPMGAGSPGKMAQYINANGENEDDSYNNNVNNIVIDHLPSGNGNSDNSSGIGMNKNKTENISYIETERELLSKRGSVDRNDKKIIAPLLLLKKRQSEKMSIAELTKSIIKEEEESPFEDELKFIGQFVQKETELENEHTTSEYFNSIKIDEIISCIFAFMGVGSGMIYYELKTNANEYAEDKEMLQLAINCSVIVISVAAFIFCTINIFILI